ncbi:CRISPR-associated endonuclease Cas2 [Methanobacterium sp. MZD130B]|jgi:CRISPR-associated protein Cas2|uniref:CRISPR-associated endonuclease Cas2 n=1 Tax=Methanobacterium sp. MZD130B TaxID=3394378 RepID=UPI0039FBF777
MLTMVIYDITDNKDRNNLIKKLQHYGLRRIQKSAFIGNVSLSKRNELEGKVGENVSGPKDSIYFVPICHKCRGLTTIFSEDERVLIDDRNYRII